jgi:phospholipid/cholesterol/gamma-HCH transport system permease protein
MGQAGRKIPTQEQAAADLSFARGADGTLTIGLHGTWRLHHGMPSGAQVERELKDGAPPRRVAFEAGSLARWDTSLLNFVYEVVALCTQRGVETDRSGLPEGLERLLELAETVPDRTDAGRAVAHRSLFGRVGQAAIDIGDSFDTSLIFIGQVAIALGNFVRGRARFRFADLMQIIQECGADALGIVTLISYLVGVILAFMGAVQLQQFGASIYVADLVAIGITREMGAMMTAIIMAGRTGAAFAAQLGTMKVSEEIDAYTTMGISPMEFLVLPRIIALILMMPLLCLYSDFVGILGGATVGSSMLGISPIAYAHETANALRGHDLLGGLFKATVYGVLIAFAGCMSGFECGNSSAAVGEATTRAVVLSIVLIVVTCGGFAVVFNILGI